MSDNTENLPIRDNSNTLVLNITEDDLLAEITATNGWQPLEDKQPGDYTFDELMKAWRCSNRTVANRALKLENEKKIERLWVLDEYGQRVRIIRFLHEK